MLVLLSAYVRPFFLLLLILSNLGGECVPTGKLCERFVVGLLLIRPLPSSSVRLLLAPPSSFHFLPVFPHICYVDRQVTTLTAPPSGTPIFSLFHSLSFFCFSTSSLEIKDQDVRLVDDDKEDVTFV